MPNIVELRVKRQGQLADVIILDDYARGQEVVEYNPSWRVDDYLEYLLKNAESPDILDLLSVVKENREPIMYRGNVFLWEDIEYLFQ